MRKRLVLMFVILLAGLSCGQNKQAANNHNSRDERVSVSAAVATVGNMTVYREYTGTVEGIEQATLTSKISETVVGVRTRAGSSVRQGDMLIELDKTGPTSSYGQAKAYFENAQKSVTKMERLYNEGAISEQQYDDAKTAFRVAESNYEAARDLVEVRSPISGMVTELSVNIGDQTFPGQKLVTVSRVDSLRLTMGVDPEDIGYISVQTTPEVYPVGGKDARVAGVVKRVAGSADPKTRAFNVEIVFAASNQLLRPGAFAGCSLPLLELENVLRVPNEAILLREGLQKAFVVKGDTAIATDVMTGETSDGYTQIVSGLSDGDRVVTLGISFLQDRTAVKIDGGEDGN
jgi:RND family efflux transporter MFP subunit